MSLWGPGGGAGSDPQRGGPGAVTAQREKQAGESGQVFFLCGSDFKVGASISQE